jgi:hypothetical protein
MSYDVKYIGMDVHKEAIVIAVQNESGKLVMESVIETKASSILQFLHGLRGELHVTWEEGTWAAWLYDLLQPHVQHIVVCNPRRNALLKEGSKSDKVDAQKLADLLRTGMLRPVYHGENGLRTLRELGRGYQTIGKDLTRVMNRLKALYRGWGIPCAGTQVYAARAREEWLNKLPQAGVRRRAKLLYQQLDGLQALRREVRPEFLAESRKHKTAKLLRQIPYIGPIRAARLIGLMQTPKFSVVGIGAETVEHRLLSRRSYFEHGTATDVIEVPRAETFAAAPSCTVEIAFLVEDHTCLGIIAGLVVEGVERVLFSLQG